MAMTAYEEALQRIKEGKETGIPSYMVAGDTLNVANGNETFLESVGDAVTGIPKFIGLSLVSGANQLYNIPANIGNLFGGDLNVVTTQDVVSTLDSDLGKFYEEHQEGIDLVGFMASSIVPGGAGVKILNAGQTSLRSAIGAGKFGANTGKALGLLAPMNKTRIATAVQEVATKGSVASITNATALRAVGAGIGQNALEAAAFEIAVATAMHASPVLENQDFGDLMSNIAFSAGIFGVIGGTVSGVKLNSALKKARNKASAEARPWQFIPETAEISNPYERLALNYQALDDIPAIPLPLHPDKVSHLQSLEKSKRATLTNAIRTDMGELAKGDKEVAATLNALFVGRKVSDQQSALIGAVEVSKVNVASKAVARIEKIEKKMVKGTVTEDELVEFGESTLHTAWAKVWGEDAGAVLTERPVLTSLVDKLGKGQRLEVSPGNVRITGGIGKDKGKQWNFSLKYNTGKAKPGSKDAKPWVTGSSDVMESSARYIWASQLPKLVATAEKPFKVHIDDLPLLEKVMMDLGDDGLEHVIFTGFRKGELDTATLGLQDFIAERKIRMATRLLNIKGEKAIKTGTPITQVEIASMVNMKSSALSGELITGPSRQLQLDDILALQSNAKAYTEDQVLRGLRKQEEGIVDVWKVPQHIKITYDLKAPNTTLPLQGTNNFVVENMAIIKQQQRLYQDGLNRAAAGPLGDDFHRFEDITSGVGGTIDKKANASGAGPKLASAASGNYGSLAGSMESVGAITSDIIAKKSKAITETLEPFLYKLSTNRKAAVEWSTLNANIRAIEGQYALNEAGDALEPALLVRWRKAVIAAEEQGLQPPKEPVLRNANMPLRVELQTDEVRKLAAAHIETNGVRTSHLAGIRTAQGSQFNRAPDVFYPIPVDPRDYKHFAMVTDESITGGSQSRTLFAATAEELADMKASLEASNPHLIIRTKKEAEDYYKSIGQYEYEKTLNNSYIDVSAHRAGVSAPYVVATDPKKIVSDTLKWHVQRETGIVREAVAAKYEVQFEELRRLGDEFTNVATSRFGSLSLNEFASDLVDNPYVDYIKTALAIRPTSSYPFWVNTNLIADQQVSKMYNKIKAVFQSSKTADDLIETNKILDQAGYKGAHYDEGMEIFANAGPDRGTLNSVVQKANSLMATVVLRWDVLNSVNNAVSANVLLGAETKAVLRAIDRGDKEAVGALAELTRIKVPGVEETIMSPTKLIANSIKKFNRNGEDFAFYKKNGYMTRISDQYKNVLDDIAFTGKESVATWNTRLDKVYKGLKNAGDKGEVVTGNRLAEEFNRFVAADVMKQMTDVAVTRKLMTAQEQLSYINTFVNRTQGNYLAAQRPMLFQGAIGQAIGLFQTYQFNLMQQLLRHVGEGHNKDALTLLGLQGSIHGMNGLPAFNALNTHVIGTASGNTAHRDAYDAVYGIAGKTAGDWLTYGIGSNAIGLIHPDLKFNLYTRGDINPRHVTIIPTNPAAVPIIQATGKFMANLWKTTGKLAAGGDISTTLLQGLEHNGISRPLAGIAQTLEGFNNPERASYSTSKKGGNVIASNDLLSLANLGRIVGGKPLDEAIALDATYRFKAYGLKDARKRNVLGQAIKTTMIAGQNPTQEQIDEFAQKYTEAGGRQEEFNKWFTQLYKQANVSQANSIQQSLNSPFTQSMQKIMGGRELRDFTNN